MKKRMKKLVALALTACMFASITACGSNEQPTKEETVKEETVSVVSEVNTESVAGIENEDTEADKQTEVEAKSEVEVKEEAETEDSESKEEADSETPEELVLNIRQRNTRDLDVSQKEEFDKAVMHALSNNGVFPENCSKEIADKAWPLVCTALNANISAERYAEMIK